MKLLIINPNDSSAINYTRIACEMINIMYNGNYYINGEINEGKIEKNNVYDVNGVTYDFYINFGIIYTLSEFRADQDVLYSAVVKLISDLKIKLGVSIKMAITDYSDDIILTEKNSVNFINITVTEDEDESKNEADFIWYIIPYFDYTHCRRDILEDSKDSISMFSNSSKASKDIMSPIYDFPDDKGNRMFSYIYNNRFKHYSNKHSYSFQMKKPINSIIFAEDYIFSVPDGFKYPDYFPLKYYKNFNSEQFISYKMIDFHHTIGIHSEIFYKLIEDTLGNPGSDILHRNSTFKPISSFKEWKTFNIIRPDHDLIWFLRFGRKTNKYYTDSENIDDLLKINVVAEKAKSPNDKLLKIETISKSSKITNVKQLPEKKIPKKRTSSNNKGNKKPSGNIANIANVVDSGNAANVEKSANIVNAANVEKGANIANVINKSHELNNSDNEEFADLNDIRANMGEIKNIDNLDLLDLNAKKQLPNPENKKMPDYRCFVTGIPIYDECYVIEITSAKKISFSKNSRIQYFDALDSIKYHTEMKKADKKEIKEPEYKEFPINILVSKTIVEYTNFLIILTTLDIKYAIHRTVCPVSIDSVIANMSAPENYKNLLLSFRNGCSIGNYKSIDRMRFGYSEYNGKKYILELTIAAPSIAFSKYLRENCVYALAKPNTDLELYS